jgi:hypothetical protein
MLCAGMVSESTMALMALVLLFSGSPLGVRCACVRAWQCVLMTDIHGISSRHQADIVLWFMTGLKYDMVYCWIIRFNEDRKIDKVRAYLDSDLLTRAIEENR